MPFPAFPFSSARSAWCYPKILVLTACCHAVRPRLSMGLREQCAGLAVVRRYYHHTVSRRTRGRTASSRIWFGHGDYSSTATRVTGREPLGCAARRLPSAERKCLLGHASRLGPCVGIKLQCTRPGKVLLNAILSPLPRCLSLSLACPSCPSAPRVCLGPIGSKERSS